jgi:hypothetical protein
MAGGWCSGSVRAVAFAHICPDVGAHTGNSSCGENSKSPLPHYHLCTRKTGAVRKQERGWYSVASTTTRNLRLAARVRRGKTPSTTRYPDGTRRMRTGRDGYDNSDAPTEMGVHSSEIVMGHRRAARPGTSNEGEAQRFFLLRPNRYVLMTYGLTTKHARHLHLANHRRSPHPPRTWSDPTAT